MNYPNFFIVGAPKCGTTSMATWLGDHPNIYMSPWKEPFHFSTDLKVSGVRSWNRYLGLFDAARPAQWVRGEASSFYLYSSVAISAIERRLPGSRYIAMVRSPVEMAPALHEQNVRGFREEVQDFALAWRLSGQRKGGKVRPANSRDAGLLDYKHWCLLGEQLARLYTHVEHERVLVIILDDVRESAAREYERVLAFLGVPTDNRENFPIRNSASEWRSRVAGRLIQQAGRANAWAKYVARIVPARSFGLGRRALRIATRERPRPPLPIDLLQEMQAYFEEDMTLLEQILGRRFPQWRASV